VTSPGSTTLPFGSWPSPFPIELLVEGRIGVGGLRFDRRSDAVLWLESRPWEQGRQTLVRWTRETGPRDISPEGMNVRDRVQEYGGAPSLVSGDLVVVSDFATGRLHRVAPDRTSSPLTPDGPFRYADLELDAQRQRILAVREDHSGAGEAVNTLVSIPLAGGEPRILVDGSDFVAAPRLSPDGSRLSWLRWDHPNMPWDGTELLVASLDGDGAPVGPRVAAGSPRDWISQPRWSPQGVLHFVAEPDGWMNLHRLTDDAVAAVTSEEAEFAYPDWVFGLSNYGFLDDGTILAIGRSRGHDRLYRIPLDGVPEILDSPYTELSGIDVRGGQAVFLGASPSALVAVVLLDLATGTHEVIQRTSPAEIDPATISIPQPIEFPTTGGRTAHGFYYPPVNPGIQGPAGQLPPLMVSSHGGPTAQAFGGLSFTYQLFTSRGIGFLDVDYGGSTGYGKAYRKRLEGEWGIVDVDDNVNGARYLADQGLVDGTRMAVRGGSSSGYTTLAALAFRDVFAAGISYFGIGDLLAFARETHKFESRYLDRLIGPLPAAEQTYRDRSPSRHVDRIACPVLVLQGAEDRVVPPAEAERIVDALFERGVPHAYLLFPGEDHGFRSADAILRAFEAELSFLGAVFGFEPADELPPLEIVRPPAPVSAGGRQAASG
jgi:dipeptidyl aminopeptidase/acylaminoacyl peptidase